ncbi:hypothetical protein V8C35DRAFT_184836 [Trichoderma chlorosporum]
MKKHRFFPFFFFFFFTLLPFHGFPMRLKRAGAVASASIPQADNGCMKPLIQPRIIHLHCSRNIFDPMPPPFQYYQNQSGNDSKSATHTRV